MAHNISTFRFQGQQNKVIRYFKSTITATNPKCSLLDEHFPDKILFGCHCGSLIGQTLYSKMFNLRTGVFMSSCSMSFVEEKNPCHMPGIE